MAKKIKYFKIKIKNLTKNRLGRHPPPYPPPGDGPSARCVNCVLDNDKIFLSVSLAGGVPEGRNQEPEQEQEPSGCLPGGKSQELELEPPSYLPGERYCFEISKSILCEFFNKQFNSK